MSSINIYGAFPTTNIGPFHYLYRITNLVENRHYYGIRTSKNILPQDDLGKKYFSSSYDKEFKKDQREHLENYKYKIIIVADSRKRVADLEIKLHQKFNVGNNIKFYNLANQSSSGFDSTGKFPVKDCNGNTFQTSVDDPKYVSGEYISVNKGKVPSILSVPKGTRRIYNSELKKNTLLKPGDELPEGWKFGMKRFGDVVAPSPTKGCRWIHNNELRQNRALKPDEEIPEGWEFGHIKITTLKGSRRIHNIELKQNAVLNPGDPLPAGWEYGMKRLDKFDD